MHAFTVKSFTKLSAITMKQADEFIADLNKNLFIKGGTEKNYEYGN